MWLIFCLSILVVNLCSGLGDFIHPYPEIKLRALKDGDDVGEPLILTPYLESGDIQEARKLASVSLPTKPELISYSGFFTVNKSADSNMYFWYFRSRENPDTAPTLIWLSGGPGASSLEGLFYENGPFYVDKDLNLRDREYSWHIDHNLIYFDNPVGTGFSWSDIDGYARNEVQVGDNLYEAMLQFYIMFPELRSNPLFISGQSYGGKYVPALGYKIHQMNSIVSEDNKMNLSGLLIGNGWSDPIHQVDYSEFLYQVGLIDANSKIVFDTKRDEIVAAIKDKDFGTATQLIYDQFHLIVVLTKIYSINNYIDIVGHDTPSFYGFISKPEIRKAIHVGNASFDTYNVSKLLHCDVSDTVAPWISKLLDHYKVCVYTGQFDVIVAYPLVVNYLSHLDFNGKEEYLVKNRTIWRVDNEVAGYVKESGNLVEVMVRNAGHTVIADQPKWALDLLLHITKSTEF